MAFLIGGANSAADGVYSVANSCRINDGDSAYMHKTPGGAGNRRTFTISVWFKYAPTGTTQAILSTGDYSSDEGYFQINLNTTGRLTIDDYDTSGSSYNLRWTTNQPMRIRDPSAWYHLVVAVDSTQAVQANRVEVYLNGTNIDGAFNGTTSPAENDDFHVNMAQIVQIGRSQNNDNYFDGYLAEFCIIDGSQLAVTSFGEFDEDSPTMWKPIDVSGLTFGTNGFYLDFEDSANLGNDKSGGTDLTEVNLAATDQSTDTPTNNFCTLNPLTTWPGSYTLAEGNLEMQMTNTNEKRGALGTFGLTSGKWYWEVKYISKSAGDAYTTIGVTDANTDELNGYGEYDYAYRGEVGSAPTAGLKINNGTFVAYGDDWNTDDIIGVALDLDNNAIYFALNGTWQASGDPESGASRTNAAYNTTAPASTDGGAYHPTIGKQDGDTATFSFNFGSPAYANSSDAADANGYGAFEYAPPSGYFAINTKNLAEYG